MFRLFSEMPGGTGGSYKPGAWPALCKAIEHTVGEISAFYHNTPMSTGAQHFLNKILAFFGSDVTTPTKELYRYLQYNWMAFAQAQRMTAVNTAGRTFSGTFYGPGIEEVLLCVNTAFDWDWAVKNWKQLRPVQVLQHPFTNDAFNLPTGVNNTTVKGLAVIQVDIPMLVIQYHAFRLWEIYDVKLLNQEYVHKTPFQFLHMHVLPNMLYSHVDNVILNRFRALVTGQSMDTSASRHSFMVTRYGNRIDSVLQALVKQLTTRREDFGTTMRSIPMVFAEDGYDLARYPAVMQNKQNKWALAVSRLNMMETLFALDAMEPSNVNQVWIQEIHREIDYYNSENGWRTQVPAAIRDEVIERMDWLGPTRAPKGNITPEAMAYVAAQGVYVAFT